MNIHFPVPERANNSRLWLTTFALLLIGLLLALRIAGQPVTVDLDPPDAFSTIRALPQALPVPEPPQHQSNQSQRASTTPSPLSAQPLPLAQPIPTPPASQ